MAHERIQRAYDAHMLNRSNHLPRRVRFVAYDFSTQRAALPSNPLNCIPECLLPCPPTCYTGEISPVMRRNTVLQSKKLTVPEARIAESEISRTSGGPGSLSGPVREIRYLPGQLQRRNNLRMHKDGINFEKNILSSFATSFVFW